MVLKKVELEDGGVLEEIELFLEGKREVNIFGILSSMIILIVFDKGYTRSMQTLDFFPFSLCWVDV